MSKSSLLSPFVFRNGVRASNRIALAPMTNLQSHKDGSLSEDELHWLVMRAEGGFGVIETAASHVALDGSLWNAFTSTKKRPEEHAIPLFRRACPADVPLLVAGGVWTPAQAQELLDKGADVISIGRAAIANPDWPAHAADSSWEPRRPPLAPDELRARGLSETFVNYMRNWKGFVEG